MSSSVANIRIEPVDVTWKDYESECWDFTNATASGLGSKYVVLTNAAGTLFYAWFDENNTDVDPAPGGTAIEVNYAASATPAAIATAFNTAVGAATGFDCTLDTSGLVATSIRTAFGSCTDSTVGNVGALITLTKVAEGKDVFLGLLDGDVEVSFEEATLELTAHQTGTTLLADLRQGVNATVSLTIKESDNAIRQTLFAGTAGGTVVGTSSTVYGWGDKQGLSSIIDAARLILHPVALADADLSRDMCFWKAYPLISSITFSGENPEVMAIEFKCYIDDRKADGINLFMFGDHTQTGLDA